MKPHPSPHRRLPALLAGWLIAGFCLSLAPPPAARAQGSLQPPGPPAPTMKSLDEIEARIPITSVPFAISSPGSYYLTTNLANQVIYVYDPVTHSLRPVNSLANTNAITILANNVTVDLNGYNLTGIASSANGILIGTVTNVTICHGSISDFGNGINAPNGVVNGRVTGVAVSDCQFNGIYFGGSLFINSLVESCTVNNVGSDGISATVVRGSTAADCGSTAIEGEQVSDSYGASYGGDGIVGITIQNSQGKANSSGTGIYVYISAANCYGYSSSGIGIYSFSVCVGCEGDSQSYTGLQAFIAESSTGSSTSGTAIIITHSLNCF